MFVFVRLFAIDVEIQHSDALSLLDGKISSLHYLFNSRGERGGFGRVSFFSPVSAKTSFNAPTLESNAEVSIGIKITFEFCVLVISRRDSM